MVLILGLILKAGPPDAEPDEDWRYEDVKIKKRTVFYIEKKSNYKSRGK